MSSTPHSPLPTPPNQPAGALAPAAMLERDTLCRNCGYNLKGLRTDARCPECETAVARSIRGDTLQFCEPSWVMRLATGALWIIGGILGLVVASILSAGIGMVVGATANAAMMPVATAIGLGLTMMAALAQLYGIWLFTSPDPGAEESKPVNARTIARFALIAMVVSLPLQAIPGARATGPAAFQQLTSSITMLLIISAGMLSSLLTTVGYTAVFVYARSLAKRVPDLRLAEQTSLVMWGYVVTAGLSLLMGALVVAALPGFTSSMQSAAQGGGAAASVSTAVMIGSGIAGCAAGVVGLVFQVWAVVLLFWYRRVFKRTAEVARATWST